MVGEKMYKWASDLFPFHRSLTGEGVRKTLTYIQGFLPNLEIKDFPSGTKVFDWTIPDEWQVGEAYIEDLNGNRIIDICNSNLHVVSYSTSVNKIIDRTELENHLFVSDVSDDAIPYITSYYNHFWGFCLSKNQKRLLKDDSYRVYIDSVLKKGVMNYGELLLPGTSNREVVFSTYICHPSMANNELSGIVLAMALIEELISRKSRFYSYRFLFLPETIGSIAYINENLTNLRKFTEYGFVLTCVGGPDNFSFMPSRKGNTKADRVACYILDRYYQNHRKHSFLERGSDERQFCSPNVDLPFVSVMKSKYKEYMEYHTSLDDLDFISPENLNESFQLYNKLLMIIESNNYYRTDIFCEPMLSKRNLYPNIGATIKDERTRIIKDILALLDGTLDILDLSSILQVEYFQLLSYIEELRSHGLIKNIFKKA